jgi:hypothetical protein
MKKLISLILILVMVVSCMSFAGCGQEAKETVPTTVDDGYVPDSTLRLLMVGNSFCYYYVEELYGVAEAAGVKMKVCNVYYSGCSLKKHWTWWKQGEQNYQYFETDGSGRTKYENYSLNMCLRQENWDVISFTRGSGDYPSDSKENTYRYLRDLLNYTKEQFPQTTFYWQHSWSYQVGYDRNGVKMESAAQQAQSAAEKKVISTEFCNEFDLIMVPCGDAWQYARQDRRVGDVLCNRGDKSDNYHDGDEGGGQYLNACVWFEVLTGKSCIGNTWRPTGYKLSEEKIAALQQAAHRAVAESRA